MNIVKRRFNKSALALGVMSALTLGMSSSASAVSFDWGEVRGTFDSTWTVGLAGVCLSVIGKGKSVKLTSHNLIGLVILLLVRLLGKHQSTPLLKSGANQAHIQVTMT